MSSCSSLEQWPALHGSAAAAGSRQMFSARVLMSRNSVYVNGTDAMCSCTHGGGGVVFKNLLASYSKSEAAKIFM